MQSLLWPTPGAANSAMSTFLGRHKGVIVPLAAALLILLINFAMVQSSFKIAAAVLIAVAWLVLILANWQLTVWGLVVFVPFIGVLEVLTYPSTTPVLAEDIFFIAPCYCLLGLRILTHQQAPLVSQLPTKLLALLAAVTCAGLLNPSLLNWTVCRSA